MSTPAVPTPASSSTPDDTPPFRYSASLADRIERRWQEHWERAGTFVTPNPGEKGFDEGRPKYYVLDMFPYPSGAGLHVGHPEGYTATDIIARYMRMTGYQVLHPMGWDAFGLPAEQYAIQTGVHPAITTKKAIDNFRRQLKRFGFSYDWSREVSTIDPAYYRWTQWIWLQAYNSWYDPQQDRARPIAELIGELESGDLRVSFEGEPVHVGVGSTMSPLGTDPVGTRRWHELSADERRAFIDGQRLAYLDEVTVNWCPKLGTVLANEEVIDGRSERGSFPVYRRPLKQWVFRITAYAQRLLDDLANLDWPESTKTMQAAWIGRSEGAEIDFEIDNPPSGFSSLRVYTTRPDTLFGATYMVVAPEHPLVDAMLAQPREDFDPSALGEYALAARNKGDVERQADTKEKTGVFTGLYAINPATSERIPIWTADYVLMGYGHGAIMAVPAHDQRDFDFAKTFGLPIRDVVYPRAVAAMSYFATHATDTEREPDRYLPVLADFLGLVATQNTPPSRFDEDLAMVRSRRRTDAVFAEESGQGVVGRDDATPELGGLVGAKRGATRMTWIDALEELKLTDFATLRERFVGGMNTGGAEAGRTVGTFYASSDAAYDTPGFAAHSAGPGEEGEEGLDINGLSTDEAKRAVVEWLEKTGRGRRKVNFRLRDWLFSRQRYWGEPFPVVYDDEGNHYPVSEKALPVTLPDLADYTPAESDEPQPLLGKATAWVNTTAGEAGVDPELLAPDTPVRRETNTMPGWAGSCWYYLRYTDPKGAERFVSRKAERYWGIAPPAREGNVSAEQAHASGTFDPQAQKIGMVDLYVGGAEHAVLHLLYARFWHKILFDLGEVSTPEPFAKLFHQGMITSYAYQRPDKTLVAVDQVDERPDGTFVERGTGTRLASVIAKMSKSLKNVVNPDETIAELGADTFRLYEMYMGPLDASKPWNTKDTVGLFRFLQRAWRLIVDERSGEPRIAEAASGEIERALHKAVAKVRDDIPRLAFNTAIAALIEFVNTATPSGGAAQAGGGGVLTKDQAERFALILSPFAPHMAEELWNKLGNASSLAYEAFPTADESLLAADLIEVPVQIKGKVRARIKVPASLDKQQLEAAARADEGVVAALAGKAVVRAIVVPGKMVNLVTE